MTSLTVAVDESVLQNAEKYADVRGTSIDQLVREYLADLARQDERRAALKALRSAMEKGILEIEERAWCREDLYEL